MVSSRRSLLQIAGTVSVAALAGCSKSALYGSDDSRTEYRLTVSRERLLEPAQTALAVEVAESRAAFREVVFGSRIDVDLRALGLWTVDGAANGRLLWYDGALYRYGLYTDTD